MDRDERETLLAVATEEEWQMWLLDKLLKGEPIGSGVCLFCEAYNDNCYECMPAQKKPFACWRKHKSTEIIRAIERLAKAGIVV